MTIETKTTIQLCDIKTVEFECRRCHRIISWPIGAAGKPPVQCACDGSGPWMSAGGETYRGLIELFGLMQRFAKTNGDEFTLRFGVEGLTERK